MKKILVIVLAVILTLSLSLSSVTFAAGGEKEVELAQEAGQAWLDSTVELTGEPLEWLGAHLTTPQVCYDLKGEPNAYMFAMENNGEVVGYIIVGSSAYGYPMFEAADIPPPAIPSADECKSILERDLGLKVAKIGNPTRLLYLGFDNLYAVYQAGQQEVAVNVPFDFAVPAANLTAAMPSPEEYKAAVEATEEAKPELLGGGWGWNFLPMYYPYFCGYYCGPSSGVAIGQYYKNQRGYSSLPDADQMYDQLYWFMSWGMGPVFPWQYGTGFVLMTWEAGYDNFHYALDYIVTGGDYWNRVADIDNGWPIALYSTNFFYLEEPDTDIPHWVAIRGYEYPHYHPTGPIQHAICCVDNWRCTHMLWLNWDSIGVSPVTVTIKDS